MPNLGISEKAGVMRNKAVVISCERMSHNTVCTATSVSVCRTAVLPYVGY